jgi:hypothetical protein
VSSGVNKFAGVLCCLVLFVSVIYTGPAGAADDDTQASVYLVFDPETGEFITVDDAAVTAQHKAQQVQEAIESVVETADGSDGSDDSLPAWLIGAALVAILLGGAAWSKRNRRHAT